MAKRLLRTALLCAVLILPLTLTAFADTVTRMYGDYPHGTHYELILDKSDGTLTGGKRRCYGLHLEIPSEIDGVPVRRIGSDAFHDWEFDSVTIPNGVVSIGEKAFRNSGLRSIVIPDSVVSIEKEAFASCRNVQSIALPIRLTKIEERLFYYCQELKSVEIPDSVTEIGGHAFSGCSKLSMPRFPGGLIKIGEWAFDSVGSAYEVTPGGWKDTLVLPDSLKILGQQAFDTCNALTSVVIPGSLTDWQIAAFADCDSLTSVVISEGIRNIPTETFSSCNALQTVSFPSTLATIGKSAFHGNRLLASVDFPESLKAIEWNAFDDTALTEVFLPKNLAVLGYGTFGTIPGALSAVYYEGSEAQWKALMKASDAHWRAQFPEDVVLGKYSYFSSHYPLPDGYEPTVHYNAKRTAQASAAPQETPAPPADIPPEERGPFDDVRKSDYFCESVVWAVGNGVTAGTSPTTFSPQGQCTRAHAITFLWRACGSPNPEGANPYSDVPEGKYYTKAAIWAYERGLTEGGLFNGSEPCTRMMAVAWLWKLAGSPAAGESPFRDVSGVSAQAAAWAAARGVTNGTSETTFNPGGTCTRAQIVTFLYRAYNAGQLR